MVLLEAGTRSAQLGLIVKMPSAATVELAGRAGFDAVMIDTEHGSNSMADLEHHIRAAEVAGAQALVRVSDARSPDILRALDAGADGIVVPHVRSPEDVADAVSRTHYAPHGKRSLAMSTRAGGHGLGDVAQHLRRSHQQVKLIVQIEDAEAISCLPDILACDGLHGAFIGPADLSLSLGYPGQVSHPQVADAVQQITDTVLASPATLCVLASDEQEAHMWAQRGAGLLLMNASALMASRLTEIIDNIRPAGKDGS